MRSIVLIAALFFSSASGDAQIEVGTTNVAVPVPRGFAPLTENMRALYAKSLSVVPDGNQQLALFLPVENAPAAMAGEAPEMRRWFAVQIRKTAAHQRVDPSYLAEISRSLQRKKAQTVQKARASANRQLRERAQQGKLRSADIPDVTSATISEPFLRTGYAVGFLLKADNHYVQDGETIAQSLHSATVLLVVKDRLMFLYVNDVTGDEEWVRKSAQQWAKAIYERNTR